MENKTFLVERLRGSSYRLKDIETLKRYRALESEYPGLIEGMLLIANNVETEHTLITSMSVAFVVTGDHEKERVKVSRKEFSIGDLIDGVPILRFGRSFYENKEKMAYAYFNLKNAFKA